MKITYSSEKIKSFGGINFADYILSTNKFYESIDSSLGLRSSKSTFNYSDVIRSYMNLTLCGGECAEDIAENLRCELEQIEGFKVPSADTLLRIQKELSTEKQEITSASGISHEFNINPKMNKLLLELLFKSKQLSSECKDYVLDYDNQFLATEKYDSKRSYKKENGYFPGIASIDNFPVYIENRNGNSNVKFKQSETLKRVFNSLSDFGVKIKYSRMDAGSFSKEIIQTVEENSTYFVIRAQRCDDIYQKVKEIEHWEDVEIGFKKYQIASIDHSPFGEEKSYRYVVSREEIDDSQLNLFPENNFKYQVIITNDYCKTNLEIIQFYNERGLSERLFDEMNNDFHWKKMPFSFLQENTVFLIIMAICRNMFHYLKDVICCKFQNIPFNTRLKKFIYRFVVLPVKWIKRGRQRVLKIYSSRKEYELLI